MKLDWRHILAAMLGLVVLIGLIVLFTGLLIVFLVLLGIGFVIGLVLYAYEKARRWRADQGGFQEQIDEGAPHIQPDLLLALMGNPTEDTENGVLLEPEPQVIGAITVGEDGLLASDPAYVLRLVQTGGSPDPLVFQEGFPHGRHEVILLRVQGSDQRVAALQVVFVEEAEPAFMEPAWTPEELARTREMREMPSLGVDSGLMALGTPLAFQALARMTSGAGLAPGSADPDANPFLSDNPGDLWRCVETPAGPVYVVYAGMGDGTYPAWIVRAEDGTALSLVIDFRILGRPAQPVSRPSRGHANQHPDRDDGDEDLAALPGTP